MLVLSRKKDETILILRDGNEKDVIKLTLVDIRGDKVRLGFEAPNDTKIYRSELWERIKSGKL